MTTTKRDMTPTEFCDAHQACTEGRKWAIEQPDMATIWRTAPRDWLIWMAQRTLSARELRLFTCFCARQNWHILTNPSSRKAVEVAEAFCSGAATVKELDAAAAAAYAAADNAAAAANYDSCSAYAAAYAAYATAADAADNAVAVCAAARAAATAARAADTANDATSAEALARAEQCAWLRENCTPDFSAPNGAE